MSDKIIVEVKSSNPCLGCSQTCDECPHNQSSMSAAEYADVEREAKEFILSLEINMRKNKEVKITI